MGRVGSWGRTPKLQKPFAGRKLNGAESGNLCLILPEYSSLGAEILTAAQRETGDHEKR